MKLALVLGLFAAPASVFAQPLAQPAPPSQAGALPSQAAGPPAPGETRARQSARLGELRAALKLRPDQEAAFGAYLEALRPDPAMRELLRAERERMAAMTPDEREEAREARAPERQAMMSRRADATRRFAAALTPDQQAAFAALRRERGERGRPGGRRRPEAPGGAAAESPPQG